MTAKMDYTLYEIYDLLNRLGLTANYAGFFHLACAVYLCVECPEKLTLVTKRLYPDVARRYRTSSESVERNLRTASEIIWRENRPLLEELARRPLTRRPRSVQLIAILCSSFDGRETVPKTNNASALTGEKNILRI